LPIFLHAAARDLRLYAALDGAGVRANFLQPVEIEGNSGIWEEFPAIQLCENGFVSGIGTNGGVRPERRSGMVVIDRHSRPRICGFCEGRDFFLGI
jgi:hypothetical protein